MIKKEKQIFDYKVVYSRRRSIGISVGPDPDPGVTVRAPNRTSLRAIENLVRSKSTWIIKHLENYKSAISINNNKEYNDGTSILFRGKQFQIRIIESRTNSVRLSEHIFEIGLKTIAEKEKAGLILEKWFKATADEVFRRKSEEILMRFKNYNFSPAEFSVRALKRRWGSCSSRGKITISSELIKLDDIYAEYVIIHELCHLRHHNHGKEFYKLLSEVFPDWKQTRKELRKFIR